MGKPTGFLEYPRVRRSATGRSTSGSATGTRSTCRCRRATLRSRPPAAWTAASRSATASAARWGTASPSSTTWSTAAAGARPPRTCTRPTTSRRSPAACAPPRARPPARWPSTTEPVTIKHIEYQIAERAFQEGWVRPLPARGRRPASGWPSSAPGRPGWPPPSSWPARATGGRLREGRPHRRPAALRHPRLQAGEARPRPPPGADGRRGRRSSSPASASARTSPPATCGRCSTRSAWHGRRPAAAARRCPGRDLEGVHFAMDFLPQQNRRVAGDPIPVRGQVPFAAERPGGCFAQMGPVPHRYRAAIHAQGKHVVGHRRRRHGQRLRGHVDPPGGRLRDQLEILPKPPEGRNPETPWPTWPKIMRTSSSHEEGCERRWSVADQGADPGTQRPRGRAARLSRSTGSAAPRAGR